MVMMMSEKMNFETNVAVVGNKHLSIGIATKVPSVFNGYTFSIISATNQRMY